MLVYILRHAIAENAPPGGSDASRALTSAGKQKLRGVLQRAREAGVRPRLILTSPLKRAVETAEIAAAILNVRQQLVQTRSLLPDGSPGRVWNEVRAQDAKDLLLAGHEPLLSQVAAYLLGCPALQIRLRKAALVCIEMETTAAQPRGTLHWLLVPKLAGL